MIFNKRNNKKNNAIIIGCGRLGSRTAGELSLDDWDVVVMDNNRDAFRLLPSFFGGSTLQANATDIEKLEEAGTAVEIRHILYTPLEATYTFAPKHAVAFIGTADPWSDVPAVIQMSEAQGVPMHVYENANHSLETSDTMQNLKILQDVMEKTKAII